MTEAEAQQWLRTHFAPTAATEEKIAHYLRLLRAEMARQNLIAAASWPQIWSRHIVDSAQLLRFARDEADASSLWLDLGSGAGFPGVIAALLRPGPVWLVESRRRRTDFLQHVVAELALAEQVTVQPMRLEALGCAPAGVIAARAFAPLPKLLALAARFSTPHTLWLLPKGANAASELAQIAPSWQRLFHVEQSATQSGAGILVGRGQIAPSEPPPKRNAKQAACTLK
jgi:16S rRNA (guanine527-N7)-methyltransferase